MYNPAKHKCKACVDLEKWKDNRAIINKNNHNLRLDKTEVSCPEKSHLNEILIAPPTEHVLDTKGNIVCDKDGKPIKRYDFVKQFEDKAKVVEKTIRKDAVKEVGVIMRLSGGWEHLPENFDLEKWKRDSIEWLKKTWGEKNILYAVLHVDEYSPHIHAAVVPITEDNRLSCKEFMGDKNNMKNMWDTYYEAVKQDGIYRGDKTTALLHEDLRVAQNALNDAGNVKLPEIAKDDTLESYKHKAQEEYQKLGMKNYLSEESLYQEYVRELSELTTTVEEQKVQIKENNAELKEKQEKITQLRKENEFYQNQIMGDGIRREELKNAAKLTAQLRKEYEDKMSQTISDYNDLRLDYEELKEAYERLTGTAKSLDEDLKLYRQVIDANGISKNSLKVLKNLDYLMYGIKNGYPESKKVQELMAEGVKYGKGIMDKKQVR